MKKKLIAVALPLCFTGAHGQSLVNKENAAPLSLMSEKINVSLWKSKNTQKSQHGTCLTMSAPFELLNIPQYGGDFLQKTEERAHATGIEVSCGDWSSQTTTLTNRNYRPASFSAIYRRIKMVEGDTFSLGLTFGAAKIDDSIPRTARIATMFWEKKSWVINISLVPTINERKNNTYFAWVSIPVSL